MRRRFFLILGFALVMGLVTGYLVYRSLTTNTMVEASALPTEGVIVAAANIEVGEALTSRHVKLLPWPKDSVPAGSLGSLAEAEGRVTRRSLVVGEPLLEAKLVPKGDGLGGILPMIVPDKLRGVTIKVDAAVRESGFVLPNSRVDIVVSIADRGNSGKRTAKVILQNVLVLAAGQTVELKSNKPVPVTTVTLALTPEQVEHLALAKTEGRLMIATRSLSDRRIVRTRGVNVKRLLNLSPASPSRRKATIRVARRSKKPRPSSHTVTVFHGNKMTQHNFVRNGGQPWAEAAP